MKRTAWLLGARARILRPSSENTGPTPDEMNVSCGLACLPSENAQNRRSLRVVAAAGDPLLSVPAEDEPPGGPSADEASESVDSASAACRAETRDYCLRQIRPAHVKPAPEWLGWIGFSGFPLNLLCWPGSLGPVLAFLSFRLQGKVFSQLRFRSRQRCSSGK